MAVTRGRAAAGDGRGSGDPLVRGRQGALKARRGLAGSKKEADQRVTGLPGVLFGLVAAVILPDVLYVASRTVPVAVLQVMPGRALARGPARVGWAAVSAGLVGCAEGPLGN